MRQLFIVFFFSLTATASENCEFLGVHLQGKLEKYWNSHYEPFRCSDNIYRLKDEILEGLGENVPVFAVYIRKWHPIAQPVSPVAARNGVTRWGFHMFLVIDGYVVDLDYTDAPQVIGWKAYMENMWPVHQGVYIQYKEAREIKSTELGGRFNEFDYPIQKLTELHEAPPFAAECLGY